MAVTVRLPESLPGTFHVTQKFGELPPASTSLIVVADTVGAGGGGVGGGDVWVVVVVDVTVVVVGGAHWTLAVAEAEALAVASPVSSASIGPRLFTNSVREIVMSAVPLPVASDPGQF